MKFESEFKNFDVQASALLGDYNQEGNYVIDAKILDELKKCIKVITSYSEWQTLATATVGSFKIDFEIDVEEGQNNLNRASLYVLESASLGFVSGKLKTLVAQEVLTADNSFFYKLKEVFNLIIADESEGKDINNSGLINIITKKTDKQSKYKSLNAPSLELEKQYVMYMISILSSDKGNKNIILQYKQLLEKKGISKLDKSYFRTARIILDSLVNASYQNLSEQDVKRIENLRKDFFKEFALVKAPTKAPAAKPPKKKKKEEKKKKKDDDKDKGAKTKGSSGGGTGGGSKPNSDKPKTITYYESYSKDGKFEKIKEFLAKKLTNLSKKASKTLENLKLNKNDVSFDYNIMNQTNESQKTPPEKNNEELEL